MNVYISWEAVIAIAALMTMLAAGLVWAIRAIVRDELAELDARYVHADVFEAHADALEARIRRLERRHAA